MNERMLNLLKFINSSISVKGKPPSFSEMAKECGVKSKQTVENWLTVLENDGLIKRSGKLQRKIFVTDKGKSSFELVNVSKINDISHLNVYISNLVSGEETHTSAQTTRDEIKLEVDNVSLYRIKGGENNGTT